MTHSDHVVAMETVSEEEFLALVEAYGSACVDQYADTVPPAAPPYEQLRRNDVEVEACKAALIAAWNRRAALEAVSSIHEAEPDHDWAGGNDTCYCRRCGIEYAYGKEPKPLGDCPAHPAPISKGVTEGNRPVTAAAPTFQSENRREGNQVLGVIRNVMNNPPDSWRGVVGDPGRQPYDDGWFAACKAILSCLSHTAGEIEP